MISPLSAAMKHRPRPLTHLKSGLRTVTKFFWQLFLRIIHPLRQIEFKIALAYTSTTLFMVIAAELVFAGAAAGILFGTETVSNAYAGVVTDGARNLGDVTENYASRQSTANRLAVTAQLYTVTSRLQEDFFLLQVAAPRPLSPITAVMDTTGRVVACAPGAPFLTGRSLTGQLTTDDAMLVRTAASLPADRPGIARHNADGSVLAAAPIINSGGKRVGLLVVRSSGGLHPSELPAIILIMILFTIPMVLLFGGITGAVFGRAATRPLTRRLQAMSGAALAWGQGDFTVTIKDRSGDEIGQLGRHLSAMSGELQRHIRAQQKLAALEERNRLARDLHDTVKQQAFAAAMQLGAARTVLTGDNGPAGVFVSQAEKLVNKVQEDLMALIHELRPALGSAEAGVVPLAVSDLSALLRQEVLDWSQASSIPANVGDMAGISAPDDVCQALLRITQEALANVARHSQASQVAVEMLQRSDATIQITLTDNGQGFDPIFTPRGMGLYSMRDRALSLPDGRFSLETTPEAGVTIRVSCAGSSPSDE